MPVDSPYPEQIANSANLPDVEQYVDTYDAAHMNNVRAFIRDMTAAIGTDPQGNCTDLTTRLVDVVSADGKPITPSRIVTVAKDNGQFESIQDAIDSITDASPNKRYTILVYPGIYTENISPKEYVDIVGASMIMQDYESAIDPVAQIQPASGHCIDNTGASNLRMSNILFKFTDASVITSSRELSVHLVNCKVYGSSATVPALFDTGYCDIHARNCSFQLSQNSHPLIKFNDGINRSVNYRFIGCHIRGSIEPVIAGDNTVYFDLSSSMFFGH